MAVEQKMIDGFRNVGCSCSQTFFTSASGGQCEHVKREVRVLRSINANNKTVKVLLTTAMMYYDLSCLFVVLVGWLVL